MKIGSFKTKIIFIKFLIERNRENVYIYIEIFFLLPKFLNEPNYETVIAIQIGIMEQTIAVLDKVSLIDTDHYNANSCDRLYKVMVFQIMNSTRT